MPHPVHQDQLELPLNLPPRPGIKPRQTLNTTTCPRCYVWHTTREELMKCLSDHEQP